MTLPLKRFFQKSFEFLLPARCLVCQDILEGEPGLCGACWLSVDFISDPQCILCGVPFAINISSDLKCLSCLESPPLFKKARASLLYEGTQKELILRFKHADATHMAPVFARWMSRVGADFLPQCQGIIPVPLHWSRLLKRRYNQAALLAQGISRHQGLPYWPTLLKRKRRTENQGQKTRAQREQNIKGAFSVNPAYPDLTAKTICLVDDVLTSGSTVNECVRVLKKAGVKDVFVLTLARVPLNES